MLVAKMAETLDRLSGGRLVLALGAGARINDGAVRALGLPVLSAAERVDASEEAIDVIHGLWSERSLSYGGSHIQIDRGEISPRPERRIPLWLGAYGPRMLELAGRKADGWVPSLFLLDPEAAYRAMDRVRLAAIRSSRDPAAITFACNVHVLVDERASHRDGLVAGGPDEVAERIAGFVEHGFSVVNILPGEDDEQTMRLSEEVLPLVRALVERTP